MTHTALERNWGKSRAKRHQERPRDKKEGIHEPSVNMNPGFPDLFKHTASPDSSPSFKKCPHNSMSGYMNIVQKYEESPSKIDANAVFELMHVANRSHLDNAAFKLIQEFLGENLDCQVEPEDIDWSSLSHRSRSFLEGYKTEFSSLGSDAAKNLRDGYLRTYLSNYFSSEYC